MDPLLSAMQTLTVNDVDLLASQVPKSFPREVIQELSETMRKVGEQTIPMQKIGNVFAYFGEVRKGRRRVFLFTDEDLHFDGGQNVHFNRAFMCRFTPAGTLQKVKEVVAMTLDKDEVSNRRVSIMQMLALKEFFPKNYEIYNTEWYHMVFQEKALYDLFHLYEKEKGLYKLPFEIKKSIARAILMAGCKLREHRVVHGDIKLENFLVFAHFLVKLSDFGHAHVTGGDKVDDILCGTIKTLAPEMVRRQFLGGSSFTIGAETDTWSLFLILRTLCVPNITAHEDCLIDYTEFYEQKDELLKAKQLLEQPRWTKEENDIIAKSLKPFDIRLSPNASRTVRLGKIEECIRKLDAKMANTLSEWSSEISSLPKRPEKITCLEDLIISGLQEDPKQRITPQEALAALETLTK